MSLYDEIADNLSVRGITGSVKTVVTSATNSAGKAVSDFLGGGKIAKTVGRIGGTAASAIASRQMDRLIPFDIQRQIDAGARVVGDYMQGDVEGGTMRLLGSGLLDKFIPGLSNGITHEMFWYTPNTLFGGISPSDAQRLYEEMAAQRLTRKNLWLLEVSSALGGSNISKKFNLLATEVEYSPQIVSGDKKKLGGAVSDAIQGSEAVELRITTMDDQNGTLKRWFAEHAQCATARDGTVGVPADYYIDFKIVHGIVSRDGLWGGYESMGKFRPASIEVSLSRREQAMEELQMSFSQIDTFM